MQESCSVGSTVLDVVISETSQRRAIRGHGSSCMRIDSSSCLRVVPPGVRAPILPRLTLTFTCRPSVTEQTSWVLEADIT